MFLQKKNELDLECEVSYFLDVVIALIRRAFSSFVFGLSLPYPREWIGSDETYEVEFVFETMLPTRPSEFCETLFCRWRAVDLEAFP